MSAKSFEPADHVAAIGWAREELYDFSRWMFLQRKGYQWQRARQHKIICDALMRVYRGECKRLIINVPPRYSKCSPRGTMVMTPFGLQDIAMLNAGDEVFSHDNGRLVRRKIKATETFHKDCVTIRSKSGRDLRVSADHPVLTQRGWVQAQHLTDDHYLIRVCSEVDGTERLPDAELDFLTLMLFEGGCSAKSLIRFTSADPEIVEVLRKCTSDLGIGIKQYPCNAEIDYHILGGAPGIAGKLLVKHGMRGCLAKNKRLPPAVFNLPLDQKYRFLSLMFATDGYVIKRHGQLAIALASEPLIDDISLLLDTCGIPNRKYVKSNKHAGAWELCIGASHIKRLAGKVDLLQKQADFLAALDHQSRESTVFGYPYDVAKGQIYQCKQVRPKIDFKYAGVMISDAKIDRMIDEIDASLVKWKMDDFIYDRVASVTPSGEDDVFHLEIDAEDYDAKNYIASGYVVHNTELAVVNFIAWAFGKVPDAEFIHASYSGTLAINNSASVRSVVQHEAYAEIFPDTQLASDAKAHWSTTAGGVMYATGTGGTITGFGAGKHRPGFSGAIILDDPHKADEARSDVMRQGVIDWFQNTLESRKNSPDTPIIVIMQRLHEKDLSGWLLGDKPGIEPGGNGEVWEHVCIPVWNEDGTALWPEKHDADTLRSMEKAAPYVFAGQYRQRPAPPDGGIIKPDMLQVVDAIPANVAEWCRGWDLASTLNGDYTAGVKLGRLTDGRYIIADVVRDRLESHQRDQLMRNTADRDRIKQSIPQDPGQAGKSQVLAMAKLLAGHNLHFSPETGDKTVRATPLASQINVGNVLMLRAPWNQAFVDELRLFPAGSFDDQADAASRAFNGLLRPQAGIFT